MPGPLGIGTSGGVSAVTATAPVTSSGGSAPVIGVTTATAGSSAVGDIASAGSASSLALSDHKHGREAFGSPMELASPNGAGAATTVARSDHQHGEPSWRRTLMFF